MTVSNSQKPGQFHTKYDKMVTVDVRAKAWPTLVGRADFVVSNQVMWISEAP
jgi:O-methyltransferase involved in polyketide biosynthesis